MINASIKLVGLIVLLACTSPPAYGIAFGASSNGVSTQFDVQADESSSISGGFTLDSIALEPVFSGKNINKFAHTYEYPDSEGNKAILSVDLQKAKKVHLAVSSPKGSAEASETLSVDSADLIRIGAEAITSEGENASVDLNIVEGSLSGYENYANANLINEFGDKTFVAWQRADVVSGETIRSSSQAAYTAEDTSQVTKLDSNILVINGQINDLYSRAGKYTYFESWLNGYNARKELYVNQSAGYISKITGKGKKLSPIVMNFTSDTSAIEAGGSTERLTTSVLDGTINNYSSEARGGSEVYSTAYSDGSSRSSSTYEWTSALQSANAINAKDFKTQNLATSIEEDTVSLTTSILNGTINDYWNGGEAGSGSYSSTDGYSSTDQYAFANQYSGAINASDFESHISATNADGNIADQTTSILDGTISDFGIDAWISSGSYSSSYGDSSTYKDAFTGQYSREINSSDFESYISATDADGNIADRTTSMLDGTISEYGSSSDSYSSASGDSGTNKEAFTDWFSTAINANDFTTDSTVSSVTGSESMAGLNITDADLMDFSSHATVFEDSGYETPDIDISNYAGFVSGSSINADGFNHDQYGNNTAATMSLVGIDAANATIEGYEQVSRITSPSSMYGPTTISWIRATESATGSGELDAWAANEKISIWMNSAMIEFEGTTFCAAGRIRGGTTLAYLAMPNPDVDPWDYYY